MIKIQAPASWARWPFRIGITVAALLLFDQAVFAGQFLSGTFGALHTHRENATFAGISVMIAAACAVLLRWPGRGPLWPSLACLGLFALIALQIILGFARMLTLHIPLGVTIIGLAAWLTIWAWRYRSDSSRAAAAVVPDPLGASDHRRCPLGGSRAGAAEPAVDTQVTR